MCLADIKFAAGEIRAPSHGQALARLPLLHRQLPLRLNFNL